MYEGRVKYFMISYIKLQLVSTKTIKLGNNISANHFYFNQISFRFVLSSEAFPNYRELLSTINKIS